MTYLTELANRNPGAAVAITGQVISVGNEQRGDHVQYGPWRFLPVTIQTEDGSRVPALVFDPEETDWRSIKNRRIQAAGKKSKKDDRDGNPQIRLKWEDITWLDAIPSEAVSGGGGEAPPSSAPSLDQVFDLMDKIAARVGDPGIASMIVSNVVRGNIAWSPQAAKAPDRPNCKEPGCGNRDNLDPDGYCPQHSPDIPF